MNIGRFPFLKTRIFLRQGLDRANHVDPAQEISFCAQREKGLSDLADDVSPTSEIDLQRESPLGRLSSSCELMERDASTAFAFVGDISL